MKRPEIVILVDFEQDKIIVNINPIFIYGIYKKYARDLPQTKWPCSKCRGIGCESCNWTGKQFKESIEELIGAPLLDLTSAIGTKFHGAGREDRDAVCLGGREFVIEMVEPRKRKIDLKKIEARINKKCKKKIGVSDLRVSNREEVVALKNKKSDKTYQAIVLLDRPVKKSDLEKLSELKTTISQQTPRRVMHRRADKIRKRQVKDIKWRYISKNKIELEITGESGLYIKELISGDAGRTKPSVSSVLNVEAKTEKLDVLKAF